MPSVAAIDGTLGQNAPEIHHGKSIFQSGCLSSAVPAKDLHACQTVAIPTVALFAFRW
jgi:hypothetical protein